MSSRTLKGVLSLAVLGLVTWAATPCACACGTAIGMEVDNHAMLVSAAERELSSGKFASAAMQASEAFPGLKLYKPGTGVLADRSLRILALAVTRADGAMNVGAFVGRTEAQRAQNLEWSVKTLRGLNAKKPNNTALQSDLGEAMSRVEAYKAEATTLLASLAERDLLSTAEGYAALARLQAVAGDSAGREAALKRCETMTKTAARVCQAPNATAAS